jgi:hypothetical protein
MARLVSKDAKACCLLEKERLVEELRECDYGSSSPEDWHKCYQWAAKKSGHRSKECLISG